MRRAASEIRRLRDFTADCIDFFSVPTPTAAMSRCATIRIEINLRRLSAKSASGLLLTLHRKPSSAKQSGGIARAFAIALSVGVATDACPRLDSRDYKARKAKALGKLGLSQTAHRANFLDRRRQPFLIDSHNGVPYALNLTESPIPISQTL